MRRLLVLALIPAFTACGGPTLETRTFELRYLTESTAEDVVEPYVYEDRPDAPGQISVAGRLLTVRETRDNLERIARVLEQYDRPRENVRLRFQIIRANGAGPVDSSIAPIEAQLRRLFRFRGYRLVAQTSTVSAGWSGYRLRVTGGNATYDIGGELEDTRVSGDSGYARLAVNLASTQHGAILNTRLNIRMGHTAVIGGQPLGQEGALILAVTAEPEVSP